MDNWKIVLLSGIISFVVALMTTKATHKNDVMKLVHEKRTTLYIEFYGKIEDLLLDHELVFDDDYYNTLVTYKPQMKLMSSDNTFSALKDFFNFVHDYYWRYGRYREQNSPYNDDRNLSYDDDGEPYYFVSDEEEHEYGLMCKNYCEEHAPTTDEINSKLVPLYESMRKDLGSTLDNRGQRFINGILNKGKKLARTVGSRLRNPHIGDKSDEL